MADAESDERKIYGRSSAGHGNAMFRADKLRSLLSKFLGWVTVVGVICSQGRL